MQPLLLSRRLARARLADPPSAPTAYSSGCHARAHDHNTGSGAFGMAKSNKNPDNKNVRSKRPARAAYSYRQLSRLLSLNCTALCSINLEIFTVHDGSRETLLV